MSPRSVAELVESAAAGLAIARLIYLGLSGRFPALMAWLVWDGISNLIGALLPSDSPAYYWNYILSVPVESVLGIIAVRELFALVFEAFPGIRSLGRWTTYGGLVLATGCSVLLTKVFQRTSEHGSRALLLTEISQRSIVFTLAIVIATIVFFLSKYPLHLTRNTLVSSAIFSAMFLSKAAALLIDSLAPLLYNEYVDLIELVFLSACLVTWSLLLQPTTFLVRPLPPSGPNPREEHLLQQLTALNQLLGRAARR